MAKLLTELNKTSAVAFKRELGNAETMEGEPVKDTAREQQDFMDIQALAAEMIEADGKRDVMFQGLQDMYKMEWEGPPDTQIRSTVAPDCHNTIQGMVDLLVGVRPDIKVPVMAGSKGDEERASRIEKILGLIRNRFNNLRGSDVEEEAALVGSLYGMLPMKLACVSDTAEALEKQSRKHNLESEERQRLKKQVAFYKDLAKRSPFLVDVLNPLSVHFQRGADGLRCVVECRERTVTDLRADWGEHIQPHLQPTNRVVYYEYWDRHRYCKWAEGELLDMGEYNLPFIPYVIQDVKGTRIFGRTEYFPILYACWKGDLWKALNLSLTMMRSNVYALGNPTIIATGKSAHEADISFDLSGGRVSLEQGDTLHFLTKDLNTTDMQQMYGALRQLVEESTMNKMIFGKPPEHVLAYSTVNLLIQGARHTLMPLLTGIGNGLQCLMEMILLWLSYRGKTLSMYGDGEMLELKASDIDVDRIEVLVKLKPDIPQDRLQTLNMAKMAVDTKLASRYTARDFAGWMQPDEEEKRIAAEQLVDVLWQVKLQELMRTLAPEQAQTPEQMQPEQPTPEQMQFIPPVMDKDEQGFTEARGGLPLVQQMGEPTPEFTESAAENMENLQ